MALSNNPSIMVNTGAHFFAFCFITLGAEEEENSSEDDSLQQQQQTVNAESLEEFSTQLKTKGKVEKLQTPPTPAPVEVDPCLEEKRVGPCKAAIPR